MEIAHRHGVLTAASLMVAAPAAADAVERARAMPKLSVGLHLMLAEGKPILPPRQVSHLVGPDGCFRANMAAAGGSMFFDPRARRQLEAEIAAQFDAFAATGLPLDHVNAHKHFHLHPTIAGLILKIGARHGLRAARAPVEPVKVLNRIEPEPGSFGQIAFHLMAHALGGRLRHAGLTVPDQVFGLRWSGAMTARRLRGLIENLPTGLTEIYLHPATANGYPGSAPGYRYIEELAALTAPEVIAAVEASGNSTGGFMTLLSAAT